MHSDQDKGIISRHCITALCGLAIAVLTLPVSAEEAISKLEPGWWEVITQPEFPGVPFPAAPKKDQFCLSAEDIAQGKIPLRLAPGCSVSGGEHKDDRLILQIECPESLTKIEKSGEVRMAGKTLTGRIELITKPDRPGEVIGKFFYYHQGKWLGSQCPLKISPAAN